MVEKQRSSGRATCWGLPSTMLVMLTACTASVVEEQDSRQANALSERCEVIPPFNSNFEPELEWAWTGSAVMPEHKNVIMAPVVVDVNSDGVPDVIFNAYPRTSYHSNGILRAISGDDGRDLWAVTNPSYRVRSASHIAAGDIDHDGLVELCTTQDGGGNVICFENTGAFKFRTSQPAMTYNCGGPSLADLEGDGSVEILQGNHVFSNTGALKWVGADGIGGSYCGPVSFAADINQDGKQEVINGRTVYRHDGSILCQNTSIGHGLSGVGNFDNDPYGEIVVVWSGNVSLLDDNCQLKWTTQIPQGGVGGAPNIADFDNDGQPEIGLAGAYRYVVFETSGAVKWTQQVRDYSSHVTGSSTFDFEGDGKAEVIYADEEWLRIYDGSTGTVRFQVQHSSATGYENPVIVDVDGDDNTEIVVPVNTYVRELNGIYVYRDRRDGWVNTRRIWNQHAYSVTHVNDDGSIPAQPTANWLTPGLNTFRSNSQGSGTTSPFAAADLIASEVTASCDSNAQNLTLSARVTNQGAAAASAGLQVAFFQGDPTSGGTPLGVATIPAVLLAGASTVASITLPSAPGGFAEIFVVADYGPDTGRELECREDNNVASARVSLACTSCIEVRLNDYNLFVLENYLLGTDVEGKVAAGGNITMNHFSVGHRLPDSDIATTLVAGGNLTLTNGGVWGNAWYGGSYSAGSSVIYPRGTVALGSPIDFAVRGTELRNLSTQLAGLTANGTTTLESWGGIMLRGADPEENVFQVPASAFTGAKLLHIEAPAGSLAVINIAGGSATFTGFGQSFGGGIDQHGVLFNFVDATSITAHGYGFWGTVLAPYAHVNFSNGSFDGGIYARSMTGNAEGHLNGLVDHDICE
jgi:choice-of-anchor A domain-containing protein